MCYIALSSPLFPKSALQHSSACVCWTSRDGLVGYLGKDPEVWQAQDARELFKTTGSFGRSPSSWTGNAHEIFFGEQVCTGTFDVIARAKGQTINGHMRSGHDHSARTMWTSMRSTFKRGQGACARTHTNLNRFPVTQQITHPARAHMSVADFRSKSVNTRAPKTAVPFKLET